MKPGHIVLIAILFTVIGAVTGFALKQADAPLPGAVATRSSAPALESMPDFSYADLAGITRHSTEWNDRVVVLNFWASWCPPCRKETPDFVALQKELGARGVQFVGIAIDDAEPVGDFVREFRMNYPVLLGDVSAVELSRKLGNRFEGLPFTVVAGRDGSIALRHAGELKRTQLEPLLEKLIDAG